MRSLIVASVIAVAGLQSAVDSNIAAELARVRSQIGANVPENQRAPLVQRLDRAETAQR